VPKSLKEYGLEPPVATITVEALEKTLDCPMISQAGPLEPPSDHLP
jgi:hypothetical protein